jgi:hypothetical protein
VVARRPRGNPAHGATHVIRERLVQPFCLSDRRFSVAARFQAADRPESAERGGDGWNAQNHQSVCDFDCGGRAVVWRCRRIFCRKSWSSDDRMRRRLVNFNANTNRHDHRQHGRANQQCRQRELRSHGTYYSRSAGCSTPAANCLYSGPEDSFASVGFNPCFLA